jgi:ligand-binding sensor domain-containing protein
MATRLIVVPRSQTSRESPFAPLVLGLLFAACTPGRSSGDGPSRSDGGRALSALPQASPDASTARDSVRSDVCDGAVVPRNLQQVLGAAGLLWLVGDDGTLDSLDLHAARTSHHLVESRVTSIYQASSGALWVTTLDPDHRLVVKARATSPNGDESWSPLMEVTTNARDAWLDESDGAPLILTRSTLYRWADGAVRAVALSAEIQPRIQPSQAVAGRSLYVGTNKGEWGGGLQRVSIDTGAVSTLAAGNLLDAMPVTSVIADATAGCVLAAVGFQHMSTRGHVLWVCGDAVTLVARWPAGVDRDPKRSEAVFSLLRTRSQEGEEYWAATPRGVHHWIYGEEEALRYGKFDVVCGVHVSRLSPTVVAVTTLVNEERSLSGPTPLLARVP